MKTLYLVRHAKSSWTDVGLSDFERPLNNRGKRDAPEMGRRLNEKNILPDLMLSSPANRALTTCNLIANQLGYDPAQIQTNKNIYHASIKALHEVVLDMENKINSLMLFGHNPGFTDFANKLARTNIYNIPTCGVFACQFNISNWHDLKLGTGKKLFYDFPKNQ